MAADCMTMSAQPPGPRQKLVAAAVSRGIPVNRVALNLGVSPGYVNNALRAFEEKTGRSIARRRAKRSTKNPATKLCDVCGGPFQVVRGQRIRCCSTECNTRGRRRMTDAEIVAAIESRKNGETWVGISRRNRLSLETVRVSIWRYLREQGLLTRDTVAAIWRPSHSSFRRSFSVASLEARHGPVVRD